VTPARRPKGHARHGLTELYLVPTKVLNQAVQRNYSRFSVPDFMFRLTVGI
jgi:hypothetical protein